MNTLEYAKLLVGGDLCHTLKEGDQEKKSVYTAVGWNYPYNRPLNFRISGYINHSDRS